VRGQQADGAGAEDGDGVAGSGAGHGGSVVAGREDIREQREVALEVRSRRQHEQVEVGERHPQVVRLTAVIRPHLCVAVRGAVHAVDRIGPQAERGPAAHAVAAGAAGDVERHGHPVARPDPGDAGAGVHDDAHVLVAEYLAFLDRRPALVHVQVGPADVGRRDPHDRVVRIRDHGLGYLVDGHPVWPAVDDCLHGAAYQ